MVDVLCIPARDDADAIAATLLAHVLERSGGRAHSIQIAVIAEMLSQVAESKPEVVCISALPPFALEHARALYVQLQDRFPHLNIVICLWHFDGDMQQMAARLKLDPRHGFCTTLPQVLQHIALGTHQTVLG